MFVLCSWNKTSKQVKTFIVNNTSLMKKLLKFSKHVDST